jgi:uncharacterized repeat protein (TIGR03803 family)
VKSHSLLLSLQPIVRSPLFLIRVALLVFSSIVAHTSQAQTFNVIFQFDKQGGASPQARLIHDPAGNLYGTTIDGGTGGSGTVFKLTPAGKRTVLYNFTGGVDGGDPAGGVITDGKGNLYGTTALGGQHAGCTNSCGVVYKIDSTGHETVLYAFTGGSDGAGPVGELIRDAQNNLYGTTSTGGANEWGTVFKLDTSGNFTLLYTFKGTPDGAQPNAALLLDSAGNLYGTTSAGGSDDVGTVFKLDPSGNESILHSFSSGTDGAFPLAPLSGDPQTLMYGTTSEGGAGNSGTIFQIDSNGNESVIHSFVGTDGANPEAGLLPLRGYLLGTTSRGGADQCGTVFALTPSQTIKLLHQFTCGADGEYPSAPLVVDGAGTLYGTTLGETYPICGNTGLACGTAFKISP